MLSPRSSSANARSLWRIWMPFTLATAGSSVTSSGVPASTVLEVEVFFEQAPAGRTSSASAATVANFSPCEWDAAEFGLVGEAHFSVVMAWSLIDAETAGGKAGQSRNRTPIAMAE